MKHLHSELIAQLPSRYRANLINSCTGYKPCTLIATKSNNGISNLAIFNSIVHMGSDPAMLGFILRPLTVNRDTYKNLTQSGFFTVNQVHKDMIFDAHHTAAKYPEPISEFDKTNLTESFLDEFPVPYVKESTIKIGCRYCNDYEIKENGCLLVIGAIEHIYLPEEIIQKDGWVKLDDIDTVANIGLDGYALPQLITRFRYAKPDEPTQKLR
ncbi:flavin reductase family protein [Maribacter sp. CXY002]|uniref:flavin reductase family protein n=1 Tax=Maribacter luteocoastalis TaxID=3407671 RepID=UPI003B66C915